MDLLYKFPEKMHGPGCIEKISVSTVGLEPSEIILAMSNESFNRNQWIYKMPNKTRQKLYFATIQKEDEDVCIVLGECRL